MSARLKCGELPPVEQPESGPALELWELVVAWFRRDPNMKVRTHEEATLKKFAESASRGANWATPTCRNSLCLRDADYCEEHRMTPDERKLIEAVKALAGVTK